jgi:hypothetical protein
MPRQMGFATNAGESVRALYEMGLLQNQLFCRFGRSASGLRG